MCVSDPEHHFGVTLLQITAFRRTYISPPDPAHVNATIYSHLNKFVTFNYKVFYLLKEQ